jgi:N,N'-diacetyllegionaminate synthase
MNLIQAGSKYIGVGQPCFITAEIGINHNGDMSLAKQMIDAAVNAGVDAVKFQNYRTEDFLSDKTLTYTYESQGDQVTESQYEMFKRCELNVPQLKELSQHCEMRGVVFFSTPTGEDGIRDLINAGAPLIKNGSDYLTHLPLIRCMAETGVPVVLSTGMATLGEVEDAVTAFEQAGGTELLLLHCTSSYPTPAKEVNLRKINTLQATFGYPVGFSDHSWGITAALGAVALGACFVEKHFTLNKGLQGPDHRFSSDPKEFRELVASIRELEQNLGGARIGVTLSEVESRQSFRLSCTAARNLPAGHLISLSDIAFRRPGNGVPPKSVENFINRRLRSALICGDILKLELLE